MKRFNIFIACALFTYGVQAQQQIPGDPKLRIGQLDNGLTYYIRANKLPEKQADFYIAQKVGSMQEDDSQKGLAHFLEHMAFNGSKNFPGNSMISYLETIGVKYGANLNAYTGFDETVYNISNVPLNREGIIDSALLILHDWSGFLLLEDKAIDKERGVIREEWRTRNSATQRMFEKILPEVYPNNKYGQRMPIGDINIINNFKYQELRDYYHKWYRPDLQGIIVVGDVDVDQIEAKIKSLFADIPKLVNPASRDYLPVEENNVPLVSIATDKEATVSTIQALFKYDPLTDEQMSSTLFFIDNYIKKLVSAMFNNRLDELTQQENPPFIGAGVRSGTYLVSKTCDAFSISVATKDDAIESGFKTVLQEVERVRRFGFTTTEYERAKADMLRTYETAYKERDKQKNGAYTEEYVRLFLDKEPAPGIEVEYAMIQQIAPQIKVEMLNDNFSRIFQGAGKDVVVMTMIPEKEGLKPPTKESLSTLVANMEQFDVKAYVDNVKNEPLLTSLPIPGTIKKRIEKGNYGTTEWVLSNGIRVIFKQTDFKEDQIIMSGYSPGGSSLLKDTADIPSIKLYNELVTVGGLGNFSSVELNKLLAGKNVSASVTLNTYSENVSGQCSLQDFETMMQLTYLYLTAPRKDEELFRSTVGRIKDILVNMEAQPLTAMQDTIVKILYNNNAIAMRETPAMMDKVNYERILQIQKERFQNISDFVFTFTGNFEKSSIEPFILQYLASLPSSGKKEKPLDTGLRMVKGKVKNHFERNMETPKSTVNIFYSGDCKYNLENIIKMDALSQILRIVYNDKVREQEGGTYNVGVSGRVYSFPTNRFNVTINFDTDPTLANKLIPIVHQELAAIAEKGIRADDLIKVREYMVKKFAENQKDNNYWQSVIMQYETEKVDLNTHYLEIVNKLTSDQLKTFAKSLLKQNNCAEVVMSNKQ